MDDDEIAAFEAMIRYIYTFDYMGEGEYYEQGSSEQWWFQVNVAHTANKYGIASSEEKAIGKLHECAQALTNTGLVKSRMKVLWDAYREYTKHKLQPILRLLGEVHGMELKKNPYFALLSGNEKMMIACVLETALRERLIKKLFRQCVKCGKGEIVEAGVPCETCCETTRTCRTVWVRAY